LDLPDHCHVCLEGNNIQVVPNPQSNSWAILTTKYNFSLHARIMPLEHVQQSLKTHMLEINRALTPEQLERKTTGVEFIKTFKSMLLR
jgi:hypothetical protein